MVVTPSKPTSSAITVRKLLDGKVTLYTQNRNPMVYARAYAQGKRVYLRTGETDERKAVKVAERWFYDIQSRIHSGEHLHEPLFAELVMQFLSDPVVKSGVSDGQHDNYTKKWNVLAPYFPNVRVSQVTLDWLEQLRIKRSTVTNRQGVQITANTIDKDITFIRQVLRWGVERKNLGVTVPPAPKRKGRFVVVKRGRPTISLEDWRRVTRQARQDATSAEQRREQQIASKSRGRRADPDRYWELYCFLLIVVGGALRVGEAYSLRWSDCRETTLTTDDGEGEEPAIHVKVLGKHSRGGVREDGWLLFGGVEGYKLLRTRRDGDASDAPLFRYNHEAGFRALLQSLELYVDPHTGMTRNTKSLRVTGINFRLLKNPHVSLNDMRKWARTSVVQLEQFYDQNNPQISAANVAGGSGERRRKRSSTSIH